MNVQNRVIQAQTKIINDLALCEEAISDLYFTYSRVFPDSQEFWKDLSQKEIGHANILRSMHKQLVKGNLFRNMGRFNPAEIGFFIDRLNDVNVYAKENSITQEEAVLTALSIESSILDAHFYDIVQSDADEYRIIASRLSADTHDHVKAVQDMLMKTQASQHTTRASLVAA
jgi:hypothetical protein